MPLKLTERFVKAIEPPSKGAVTVWDADLAGFGVRVFAPTRRNPDGARAFFFNYRVDGAERRFTIGSPPAWTVEAARGEARELRKRVDRGDDPAADKRERRDAPTVNDLADRYLADHMPGKSEKSQYDDGWMIKNYVIPRLGDRKVVDVHGGDIEELHKAISAKGLRGKPAPVVANRVAALVSKRLTEK